MVLYKFDTDNLAYCKINKPMYLLKYIGITLGICLTIGIFSSMQYIEKTKVQLIKSEAVINLITNESFSKEKFFEEIDRSNFKFPDIIKAQALIESQHFTSPVWKENNNALGMRLTQYLKYLDKVYARAGSNLYSDLIKTLIKQRNL